MIELCCKYITRCVNIVHKTIRGHIIVTKISEDQLESIEVKKYLKKYLIAVSVIARLIGAKKVYTYILKVTFEKLINEFGENRAMEIMNEIFITTKTKGEK
jgi:hypothetical protein